MSSGFADKLYWRAGASGRWHCFKRRAHDKGYISLCGRETREYAGGQAITRPVVWLRCGQCDGMEMDRRGWDESGPAR